MQIVVTNSKGGCGKSTLVASLSDVLDADIIDHDNQGTISVSSFFTKRHVPVSYENVTKKIIIHDTPPYNSEKLSSLLKEADLVLIPCKLQYPDFLALRALDEILKKGNMYKKSFVVFNEVRKPHNNTYKELKSLYSDNYPAMNFAKTELSNLLAFSRVLADPLKGKGLKEMRNLVAELSIY